MNYKLILIFFFSYFRLLHKHSPGKKQFILFVCPKMYITLHPKMKNSIIKIQFDSILQYFFLCGSFKWSSCGNLKCSCWRMIFKFPSFFELSSNIFAWFNFHQTHQQRSYHHGQRLFEMTALRRKLHTGIDRMTRDSHYPIPLECRLSCATIDERVKAFSVNLKLCKTFKNLHQRWLRFGQTLVQADDPVARSDKTRSHLIEKWKTCYGLSGHQLSRLFTFVPFHRVERFAVHIEMTLEPNCVVSDDVIWNANFR